MLSVSTIASRTQKWRKLTLRAWLMSTPAAGVWSDDLAPALVWGPLVFNAKEGFQPIAIGPPRRDWFSPAGGERVARRSSHSLSSCFSPPRASYSSTIILALES